MNKLFANRFEEAKEKILSVEIKPWKNKISAIFYTLMCILTIVALFVSLQYAPIDKREFLLNLLSLSIIWLISELLLIWFFYKSNFIPLYARYAFAFIIVFSNFWFLNFALNKVSM